MTGATRERLSDNHPKILTTSISRIQGCLIIFALPFTAVGLLFVLVGLGVIPAKSEDGSDPSFFVAMGSFSAICGLAMAGGGVAGIRRIRDAARRKAEHPEEPWMWDHAWDSKAAYSGGARKALIGLAVSAFLGLMLSFANRPLFAQPDAPVVPVLIVGVLDLALVWFFLRTLYQLFQYFKYGRSRLHFARFPFRPGSVIEVGLEASRRLSRARALSITVRYIEEIWEYPSPTSTTGKRTLRLYSLHEIKQELPLDASAAVSSGDIPIVVRLPAGADYGTSLLTEKRRYWEMHIKADTPGIDYEAHFLLPVY